MMLGSSICVLARFASPHGSNCIKPHKLFRIHRAKLIAPIAAPPIIPPVVWLTSPLLNPKTRLAISTESFTIPAQRALLISLLPHQYQGDISRKALTPSSSIFRLPTLCRNQKAPNHTLSYTHHTHQKRMLSWYVVRV
jgi:hypothetical protein